MLDWKQTVIEQLHNARHAVWHTYDLFLLATTTKLDGDWVRWAVEKILIPSLVGVGAVFWAFDKKQADYSTQLAVVNDRVVQQAVVLQDMKKQQEDMKDVLLDLRYQVKFIDRSSFDTGENNAVLRTPRRSR